MKTPRMHMNLKGKFWLTWLGLGSFLGIYCCGPICSVFFSSITQGWEELALAEFTYFLGSAAGCTALLREARETRRRKANLSLLPWITASACVMLALTVVCWFSPQISASLEPVIAFLLGIATSFPLAMWYEMLFNELQTRGRTRCIVLLASAEIIPIVVTVGMHLIGPMQGVGLIGMLTAMAISALCQALLCRNMTTEGSEPSIINDSSQSSYRQTPYSISLLCCFGVVWGMASCSTLFESGPGSLLSSAAMIATVSVSACLAIIIVISALIRGIHFGGFVRISVIAAGAVLALMPALRTLSPGLLYSLCEIVFVFVEIAVILFSLEICDETGLDIIEVASSNHAMFAFAACISALLFWLDQTLVGGQTAWELVAAISTIATLSLVQFLPSRMSDAAIFTLEKLPEDEGYDSRIQMRRESLVSRYQLNEREAEVLELLLRGMTREQIANELNLSPWTIKDRTGSIYKKIGVHSYKELLNLVSGEELNARKSL